MNHQLFENKLLLIAGESGTGKSTLANHLMEQYDLLPLDSYTTRPRRTKTETGHFFVNPMVGNSLMNDEDYLKNVVAYTFYNGHHYWSTIDQVESSDLYVIDRDGIVHFMKSYNGEKKPIVVRIKAPIYKRVHRMRKRGDSVREILSRLWTDYKMYRGIDKLSQITLSNLTIQDSVEELKRMLFFF